MNENRRPLLRDVARRAGVSLTTVSIVLNGKAGSNIPPETQGRVVAAAAELGYRPNAMARGLRQRRSDTIGFVSDEIATTPFAGAMIQGAQDAAWESGIVLLLVNTGRDRAIEARALDIMHERQVDALIYATMYHQVVEPPPALREVPSVLLDARSADASLASVVPDEVNAARAAVGVLVRNGHRRIGFANTIDPVPAAFERLDGYRSALAEHGIGFDASLVARGESSDPGGGEVAAARLLDRVDRPTGLFCFNDRMALGAYRAIRHRGLRVPDDVSVVGFDNEEQIAPWLDPPLTTLALPHFQMGRWAVEYLLTQTSQSGTTPEPLQYRMPCPLIERSSVAANRAAVGAVES
jgi:LacI family transcriptional regulator